MATAGSLDILLTLESQQFKQAMQDVTQRAKGLSRDFRRVGATLSGIGSDLTRTVTLPIAGIGAAALAMGGDFQQGMNQVRALTGATGDQFDALSSQAKELGRTTQFSASQAAEAMGFLAMAGFDANEILDAMPGTLQLAASAQMDLGRAADIVSNILTGYGLEVEELARANDVLVKAFTSANMDLNMLGEAFKYVGPIARGAGVEFEEAAAAIGLMGNAGIQGSMAGTSLRKIIGDLLEPTGEAARRLEDLGVNALDSSGNLLPLVDIVAQLEAGGMSAADALAIFGQRGGPAMAALVGQGSEALRELTADLHDSAGTAADVAAVQMEGFNGAMRALKSAFEGMMIAIAESGLLEWAAELTLKLTALIQRVTEGTQRFAEAHPHLVQVGIAVAAVAAAIGPLLVILGTMISTVGSVITAGGMLVGALGSVVSIIGSVGAALLALNPVVLAIGATVVALGVIWVKWGDDIKRAVKVAINWVVARFGELKESLKSAFDAIGAFIKSLGGVLQGFVDRTKFILDVYLAIWTEVFGFVTDRVLRPAFDLVKDLFGPVLRAYVDAAKAALGVLRAGFQAAFDAIRNIASVFMDGIRATFDRLTAIAETVRNTLGRITGFFRDMADEVVGNSIVPDMMFMVENEFDRGMAAVLTTTKDHTEDISGAFGDMATDVDDHATGLMGDLEKKFGEGGEFAGLVTAFNGISEGLGDGLAETLGGIEEDVDNFVGAIGDFLTGTGMGQFAGIADQFIGTWNKIKNAVGKVVGAISDIFDAAAKVFEWITSVGKGDNDPFGGGGIGIGGPFGQPGGGGPVLASAVPASAMAPGPVTNHYIESAVAVEGPIIVQLAPGEDPEDFARRLTDSLRDNPRVRMALGDALSREQVEAILDTGGLA